MQNNHQIVISGIGGQGVLFVTRLLAEAAIAKGLPVFTSETHGMAQRGGTVISHLKVGPFTSPLINPGRADGLIALKAESVDLHGGYLNAQSWAAINSPSPVTAPAASALYTLDADRTARTIDDPRSVNLIMLGFTLASAHRRLFCGLDDIVAAVRNRLRHNQQRLQGSIRAIEAGANQATTTS